MNENKTTDARLARYLFPLYGGDTRSVRVFNLGIHLMWVYLIILHLSRALPVNLPSTGTPRWEWLIGLATTTCILTSFSFLSGGFRTRLKHISLLMGAVTQVLISFKYAKTYPPFDVMVMVCSGMAVWLTGGAFYIKIKQDIENVENALGER